MKTIRPIVLVIDDDIITRTVLITLLREEGFFPLEAPDGKFAQELLAQQKHPPQLIFCDFHMPNMGGEEFIEWLRQQPPPLRDTKTILIASMTPKKEREASKLSTKVQAVLRKPILKSTFHQILKDLMH